MKTHLALASTLVLAGIVAALAQVPPPAPGAAPAAAPPAAGAPAAAGRAGRGGPAPLPPANPFPVGGTDNVSDGDYTIGPDYVISEELRPHAAWATGELHEITMLAKDSKIYPGRKRKVGYQADPAKAPGGRGNAVPGDIQWEDSPYEPRHVWVYIPAGVKKTTPLPVIIVQDGGGYQSQVRRALDALISQKKLPPIAMVALDPGSTPVGAARAEDAQGSERGYEYDTVNGRYSDFIEKEVLPRVSKQFGIRFTKDPDGRATLGGSSGAAAAFTMAWFHPERYHRVVIFSPTFVNQQSPVDPANPRGAWEYHDHLIADAPTKPLRIWMEVGERDNGYQASNDGFHNWVTAANRTAAVLKQKGYHYRYVFAKDAGHTDNRVREQTMAAALEYVWAGYKPSGK
ncbi:MAG: esterase family protein [Alphaproteobacteria bacterium]|nr:esterase family protein [Alphaproteobacteria bacterium]